MSHSRIKKVEGIPNLYVDEVTGFYLVRIYHAGHNRSKSLRTKNLTAGRTGDFIKASGEAYAV